MGQIHFSVRIRRGWRGENEWVEREQFILEKNGKGEKDGGHSLSRRRWLWVIHSGIRIGGDLAIIVVCSLGLTVGAIGVF